MAIADVSSSHSVRIKALPPGLLQFPPADLPSTLSPPSRDFSLAHPFAIPPSIYNGVLSFYVPVTVALLYLTAVTAVGRYNDSRNHKPWAISRTRSFAVFVVVHNILLTLYSAWTFVGLVNALTTSLDGVVADNGLVGVVDTLCKINGPRGLGDAATFNASTGTWGLSNRLLKLDTNNMPDSTDRGRIWNEGLAFYGWIFYLSKFYEIVDTLIVLAKGKRSSFLQTYHHAGAMICMWASIRYMAAPVWMFVLVNSFIHTLMVSSSPSLSILLNRS
jgi:hypothetical protein